MTTDYEELEIASLPLASDKDFVALVTSFSVDPDSPDLSFMQRDGATAVIDLATEFEKYGVAKFAQAVSNAKGSGVITPDLTVEESDSWRVESDKNGLNRIYVVAPSTTSERLAKVTSECSGFIYAASLMGVTGTRDAVSANASSLVNRIRSTSNTPVAVGLGVSTKEQAKVVASYADGVIVGSAFIKIIQENGAGRSGLKKVKKLAQSLSEGVRDGR